jgi:hypothetical protein
MTANYGDPTIRDRDKYYYMGKCYGNCQGRKYKYEAPLVPSSKCAPPGMEIPKTTYATPQLNGESTSILPMMGQGNLDDEGEYSDLPLESFNAPEPTLVPDQVWIPTTPPSLLVQNTVPTVLPVSAASPNDLGNLITYADLGILGAELLL